MSTPHHRSSIPAGLAATRLANGDAFLATRGLDRAGLSALLRAKTGDALHILLTSSPVHGLANPTSDLDFIRVQAEELTGPRMATQLFEGGQHLEAISFGEIETERALADLARLAADEPTGIVAGHRRWDKCHDLRRKYLERLVNGVNLDGTSPYLGHLPALARVWKWCSLHTAAEQVYFLRLAEAAGERRGRVGYALGALLHLMDAALSHRGHVYSNRKWYLLRWTRFLASDEAGGPLVEEVERVRQRVEVVLGGADTDLGPVFCELIDLMFDIVGEGRPAAVTAESDESARHVFLPGAQLMLANTAVFVGAGRLPEGRIDLTAPLDGAPGDILRAARAGALRLLPT